MLALTTEGKLYASGYNNSYCLTSSVKENSPSQEPILVNLPKVTSISANESNSACISMGKIYYWGKNFDEKGSISKPKKLAPKDSKTKNINFSEVHLGSNFVVAVANEDVYML